MRTIALASLLLPAPAAALPGAPNAFSAHRVPGELLPRGASLIVHRSIKVAADTVATPITEGEGTGCVLRHEKSDLERTLKAGTRLVVGGMTHPNFGEKGLYAAVLEVANYRDVTVFCSTFPSEQLTLGGVLRAVAGTMEFSRSAPPKLQQLASAGGDLGSPAAPQRSAFETLP